MPATSGAQVIKTRNTYDIVAIKSPRVSALDICTVVDLNEGEVFPDVNATGLSKESFRPRHVYVSYRTR